MARIGSLFVNLLLEDASFIAGLKRATAEHEKSMDRMKRATDLAAASVKGLLGGITIGAIASFGRQMTQFADDLATAADQSRINVERYQSLAAGLRKLELSTDQTDKVLKSLSVTLGEIQSGTVAGAAAAALDKMGISTRVLSGEIDTTDGLLDAIAASTKKFRTEAEFAAAVVDITNKKIGVDLAAALRDGGLALKQSEQAFRDAGNVISQDYLTALADANEAIERFTERTRQNFLVTIGNAVATGRAISQAYGELGAGAAPVRVIERAEQLFRDQQQLAALNRTSDRLGSGSGTVNFKMTGLQDFRPVAAKVAADTRAVTAAAVKARKEVSDAEKRLSGAAGPGLLEGAFKPLDETAERLREIQQIAIDIPQIQPINLEALELAQDFQRNLVEGLGQAIVYGRNLGDALVASIQAAAAQLVTSGLLKLLNGGGDGSGGFIGSIISGIGTAFGGARANGGPVSAGRAYLVGEKGPEILFPGMSGTIASNRQAFGGRQMVEVNVTASPELLVTAIAGGQLGGSQTASAMIDRTRRPQLARGAGAA